MDKLEIKIRPATEKDLLILEVLWLELMEYHLERDPRWQLVEDGPYKFLEFVRKNVLNEEWLVIVADAKGFLVGYAMATEGMMPPVLKNPRFGHILDIMVTEKYRRKGVATLLYQETVKWFKDRDLNRVELQVATTNESSQAFWKKMGFSAYLKKVTKNI